MDDFRVTDFTGAIMALNSGESIKALATVVGELLRGAGVLEEGTLYARSQISDRATNKERARREAEEERTLKLASLRVRPSFRLGVAPAPTSPTLVQAEDDVGAVPDTASDK